MPDAVIVSACRTAIGTSFKGTLVDTDATVLGWCRGARSRWTAPASPPRTSTTSSWPSRSTEAACWPATSRSRPGWPRCRGWPMNRHCASGLAAIETAAGSIMAGMDQAVIAGGVHSMSTAPTATKRTLGTADYVPWMSPSHPETPGRAGIRHVDHRRLEHGQDRRHQPGGDGRLGPALPRAGHRRHRRGALHAGDRAHQGHHGRRRRPSSSRSTSTPAAGPRWRSWPASSPSTPRSRASPSRPATPRASTTPRPLSC